MPQLGGTASAPATPPLSAAARPLDASDVPALAFDDQALPVVESPGFPLQHAATNLEQPTAQFDGITAPTQNTVQHHAQPRRHGRQVRHPYDPTRHPNYSLAGSHPFYPYSTPYMNPMYGPPRRKHQIMGLGSPMPTYQEMQAHKAMKARRAAAHQNGGERQRHHHHHTEHTPVSALAPAGPTTQSFDHLPMQPTADPNLASIADPNVRNVLGQILQALQHSRPPTVNGMTPLGLTPTASRAQNPENGNKGSDLKRSETSVTSCSSDSGSDSDENEDEDEEPPNPWARFRNYMREPFAEFLGTAILILFGNGVNNQFFLSADPNVSAVQRGTYLSVSFGWGIGVAMGVYVAGGISGGHLNPAVTLALACYRKFPWRKVLPFWIAQVLGAMTGAALVSLIYERAISIFEGGPGILTVVGPTATANLYTTFPLDYMSPSLSFFNEFLDTAILLIVIFAIGDRSNSPPPDGLNPIVLLWLVVGIGACLGSQTAYCINPARDLGPRLMLWARGYGTELWTFRHAYFIWTPILAPFTGALAGGLLYDLLIYTGAESPINAAWEWRWSKQPIKKQKMERREGDLENEKLPAGGDRDPGARV